MIPKVSFNVRINSLVLIQNLESGVSDSGPHLSVKSQVRLILILSQVYRLLILRSFVAN